MSREQLKATRIAGFALDRAQQPRAEPLAPIRPSRISWVSTPNAPAFTAD